MIGTVVPFLRSQFSLAHAKRHDRGLGNLSGLARVDLHPSIARFS